MNLKEALKSIIEKMPDRILVPFTPLIRLQIIKNKEFQRQYNLLENWRNLSDVEKKSISIDNLRKILVYANNYVPYYKELFSKVKFNPITANLPKELCLIPNLTKELIIKNFESLKSNEDLKSFSATTGGSSGKPLTVLLDLDIGFKEKAYVYYYWSKLGYDYKNSKIASFRGVEFNGRISKLNPVDNGIILSPFSLNKDTVSSYLKKIDDFGADYLHGYPSALVCFVKLLKKQNLSLSRKIKGIFFVSENLYSEDQKFVESFFNCGSLVFYGHSERAVFAEKVGNSYEFNGSYSYTELLPTDNINEFSISTTGLNCKAMPLIRYVTDDIVTNKNGVLDIQGHRIKESLIGFKDEIVTLAAINFHSNEFSKIKEFQFVQVEKGLVTLKLVEDKRILDSDKALMLKVIDKKVENILKVTIEIVPEIKLSPRGKHQRIVNSIEVPK